MTAGELLGQRVREIRTKRGLTQVDLAARLRTPQGRVSDLERGLRVPNLETILRVAAALECKPTALMSVFDPLDLDALLRK